VGTAIPIPTLSVTPNEPLISALPVNGNGSTPAFNANEAVVANEADVAESAVPISDPENVDAETLPSTSSEPVMEALPETLSCFNARGESSLILYITQL
jgi:hypothetical protein